MRTLNNQANNNDKLNVNVKPIVIRLNKKKSVECYERNTESNYDTAKRLALNIPNGNDVLFNMFVDLSMAEGITCGECYGFQCSGCWRGVIVVYATLNKPFFEWLHRRNNHTGVTQILSGITQISKR